MKVLFVEPPKDIWFVMGEYLPPPFGIIQLAAYLEREVKNAEIEVVDCNAEKMNWLELEKRIQFSNPDILASSSLATCNTYLAVRILQIAKNIDPGIITVAGGQHFTAVAQDSLETFPEIDVIVRGEGERTLAELVKNTHKKSSLSQISGISYRDQGKIIHNPRRSLIENLDELPYPGYHFVKHLRARERQDTAESITDLRVFANDLDPDFAIFAILTPFPGTILYEEAKQNGWIEDTNWSNYDMIHAIMPTETLSRKELQEELYKCYRSFYDSWNRRMKELLASNELKRRIYWYMLGRGIISQLRTLYQALPSISK